MTLYDFFQKASNALYRFFAFPVIRVSLGKCGKHVRVAKGRFSGINNVQIGNNVSLGIGFTLLSSRAKIILGDDVHNVPPYAIVGGVPAKVIRMRNEKT